MPAGSDEQVLAAVVARGAAADVVDVEGVGIDELQAVVAAGLDRWHGQQKRFGAQVRPQL